MMFVIAGLLKERDEESNSQVPGLGDVPVLGALFRRRAQSSSKTEIAVLITPHIVREPPTKITALKEPGRLNDKHEVGKIWDEDFVMALSNSL